MSFNKTYLYWWIPLILLCVLAYFIQSHMYLYKDNASLLHVATAWFNGQTYGKYIFEPNPPMIFYVYMPAVIFSKLTTLNILVAFRLYVITAIFCSLAICYGFAQALFKNNNKLMYFLLYVLAYCLLFLPAYQFAQREHMMLILTLPYFFALAARLENKFIPGLFVLLIGILAGIGFALKPYFLAALLLAELSYAIQTRRFFSWFRIDTIAIGLILVGYLVGVMIFYPDYFHIVLPLWLPYYLIVKHPWSWMLSYPGLIFCIFALAFYFISRHTNHYRKISNLFVAILLGFIISFLIPRVIWYYHILPAITFACLVLALSYGQLFIFANSNQQKLFFGFCGLLLFCIPLFFSVTLTAQAMSEFRYAHSSEARLMAFLRQHRPNNSFDYFSVSHELLKLEFYGDAHYVGNFPFFPWEYYNYFIRVYPNKNKLAYQQTFLNYGINLIANELNENKPEFVIINTTTAKLFLGKNVDYVKKYSVNKNFLAAWQHYHYLTTIGSCQIYQR